MKFRNLHLIIFMLMVVPFWSSAEEPEPEAFSPLPVYRDPETLVVGFKEGMQEKVLERWVDILKEDANLAATRNHSGLYPNSSLQAYVNKLGQSLIPSEVADHRLLSFRIVSDPLPFADALATGTVYISTGLLSLLDNESQLAFVLMQEASHIFLAHHMKQAILDEKDEKRARKIKIAGSAVGMLTAGILDGDALAALGGVYGYKGAGMGFELTGRFRNRRYLKASQYESDQYAADLILQQGFDAREAPVLMAKIDDVLRKSSASAAVAFGGGIDLQARIQRMEIYIEREEFGLLIDRILDSVGFLVASPRFGEMMAVLKRDNGQLALAQDLFYIAKLNLEESSAIYAEDPVTMLALGRLYRMTARSDVDRSRAAKFLRSAMQSDGLRHRHPEAYLELAVELLSRDDPRFFEDAQKALKTYVALFQRRSGGALPPEMQYVYDCLARTGEENWVAYDVKNINDQSPYQLTGEVNLDSLSSSGAGG